MKNNIPYLTNKIMDTTDAGSWRLQAVEHGIIDSSWEWLLTTVAYDRSMLHCLQKSLAKLELLIEEIWRTYCHQPAILFQELGIPEWMYEYIKLDKSEAPVPLRWDIIFRDKQWKILEINTGYCLGGLNGFSVNRLRDNFFARSGSDIIVEPLDNSFNYLAKSILPLAGYNSVVPVIETAEGYKKYNFYLHSFVLNMNKTDSFRYIYGTISDFNIKEDVIYFKGHVVTHFIPMFNLYELSENEVGHQLFLYLLKEKKIVSLLGLRELIFSNKAFIPWLVRYAAATLPDEDAQEIAGCFPCSAVLTRDNIASFYEADFILKPAEGYGGSGIVCSWLCQREDWITSLQHALSDDTLWLVQERIIGNISYMQSVDCLGNIKEGHASVVHGFITLHEKMIGNVTRAAIGVQQPGVINAHQGGAVGLSSLKLQQ